ncbi:MAG: OmpA/MotB domain protein [Proteobacteria bacterium]|nr:OmpA/MotB domain protein [Pseudomonadota bacterium]
MLTCFARAFFMLCLGFVASTAVAADKRGCSDHPLFPTRMPDYFLADCKMTAFEKFDFFVLKGPKHTETGKFFSLTYNINDRKNEQSGLAIVRNYENAITKIGGTIVASDPQRWVNGKLMVDGKEIWVQVEKGNGAIWLKIIEKASMQQHIVADAASIGSDLKATGHVAVYGIYFDTGKSVVKPESKPALEEVAKLLKADAMLKLWVVGHTDSVGKVEDNMQLAQARAEAVVAELASAHGISAARLKGYGVGPLSPVAGNETDAGRGKNRRVELVKQP